MPALTGVMEGEKVDLSIKMYFGEVELRVEGMSWIAFRQLEGADGTFHCSCHPRQDIWYNLQF